MDLITMIGNTGTYIDSPYHRYEGGTDLAGLELATRLRCKDFTKAGARAGEGIMVTKLRM